jgi:phage major head subunit gpT-like protein
MDQSILSSRAVLGMYYARLENPMNAGWIAGVSNLFGSDQASEQYPFLGQMPRMREWLGGRQAKGLRSNSLTIANKHYEATVEIALRDLRRDKTAQLQARMAEFADEGDAHWGTLLSALILAGTSTACYDGQYFFDTDHTEGDSGTQDNDIQVDISAVPVARSASTSPARSCGRTATSCRSWPRTSPSLTSRSASMAGRSSARSSSTASAPSSR